MSSSVIRYVNNAVLTAEVVHHYFPRIVELHNYSPANSTSQKLDNWRTLNRKLSVALLSSFYDPNQLIYNPSYNTLCPLLNWPFNLSLFFLLLFFPIIVKVFSKFNFNVPDHLLKSIVSCKPGAVEYILNHLRTKVRNIKCHEDVIYPSIAWMLTL